MTEKPKKIPLNRVLALIYNELLIWFVVLTVFFIITMGTSVFLNKNVFLEFYQDVGCTETNIFCGRFNGNFFKFNFVATLIIAMILLFVAMILVNGKPRISTKEDDTQMRVFMALSITTLSIYILLTGGFLDSPFSSALSVYLAGYLLIQERDDNKISNLLIMFYTTILIVLPYAYQAYFNTDDITYFFDYSKNDSISISRLSLSYGLAIFSLYSGHKINKKINNLYETK